MAHLGVQFIWIGEFILHVLLPFKMMILIHAFDLFSETYFFSLMITILFVSIFEATISPADQTTYSGSTILLLFLSFSL